MIVEICDGNPDTIRFHTPIHPRGFELQLEPQMGEAVLDKSR